MMNSRASLYVTTALAGGVLAGLFVPTAAFAACNTANSADNGPQFQSLIAGTVNAVSSVVTTITTTDTALVAQGSSAFVVGSPTQAPDQLGGGVWARGVGGNFLTSVPSNGVIADTQNSAAVACQSRTRQGFGGAQVGADVANLNFGGSGGTLHVGLTSGFVETSAVNKPRHECRFPGAVFRALFGPDLREFFCRRPDPGKFF